VIHVAGASGSGKTTLIGRLIPLLRAQGVRVGTVKHAHHGFALDIEGKDSWCHAQAGAEVVAVIGPTRAAWFANSSEELTVSQAVQQMGDRVDLVLVEGFKREGIQRIVLSPSEADRCVMRDAQCSIGIAPWELNADELDTIVQFCRNTAEVVRPPVCPPAAGTKPSQPFGPQQVMG